MSDELDIEWEADAYEEFQRLVSDVERGLELIMEERAVDAGCSVITKSDVTWARLFLRNRWPTLPGDMEAGAG